jgi:hypothetical protein
MFRNRAIAGAHCGCSEIAQVVEVLYNEGTSGSNSAVECDLAKVEVAGSNPVSRSRVSNPRLGGGFFRGAVAKW